VYSPRSSFVAGPAFGAFVLSSCAKVAVNNKTNDIKNENFFMFLNFD
jgi:hypothetical protein